MMNNVIKAIRIVCNGTSNQMGDKLGCRQSFISQVERKKRKVPSAFLDKISVIYNISEDKLEELNKLDDELYNLQEIYRYQRLIYEVSQYYLNNNYYSNIIDENPKEKILK